MVVSMIRDKPIKIWIISKSGSDPLEKQEK